MLLTTHRDTKNKLDIIWEEKFELLKEFKEKYNRFPSCNEIYKAVNIGQWAYTQKQVYRGKKVGILTQDRVIKLKSIGFDFGKTIEESWEENFELLKEFKEKYNRFPYCSETYKGVKIGKWINNQRQIYRGNKNGILTQDRISKLQSIGFDFDIIRDKYWEENFELLKEFKEKYNRFPTFNETYKGVNLGKWLNSQKQVYRGKKGSILSQDRVIKLKFIGFDFGDVRNKHWEEKFELLKEFKEKYNRFPYCSETYKGVKIGKWCNTQRQIYGGNKNGVLTQDRISNLQSIGFDFDKSIYISWEENFELLKEFKEKYGKFPIYKETYKGVNLGIWACTQRQAYRNSKNILDQDKIEKLQSIEFDFGKTIEESWEENFELLKEFKEKYGKFPIYKETYKGVNLGKWVNTQKQIYRGNKNGVLNQDRVSKLKSIGFNFDTIRGKYWEEKFELLKEFKEKYNRLPQSKEIYKGVKIGQWCDTQKQNYRKGKLLEDRIIKLQSINVL